VPSESRVQRLSLEADEWWWGGAVADGHLMPFGRVPHRRNLATSAGFLDDDTGGANQSAPLLVSSAGRYIWLQSVDGVDGFKFDAGDLWAYRVDDVTMAGDGAVGQCEARVMDTPAVVSNAR
jgi:hypothetical protein